MRKDRAWLAACWVALAAALLSWPAMGQAVFRYRRVPGRQLLTAAQLDSLLAARNQRLAAQGLLTEKKLGRAEQRHDTLFLDFSLRTTTQAVRDNEQRYLALVGKPLPDFVGRDLAGQPVALRQLVGQPLVINMWFTSCPPCLAELPTLNQFQAQYPGVAFLAMTYETPAQVQAFLQAHAFGWRQLPAAGAYCAQFTQDYPISVFVDRRGIIQQIIGGLPQRYDSATHQPSGEVNALEFARALQDIVY